ncbi:sigma-70 family RNA polymerase sigma factor [Streptomyces sp. SID8352]|nr:sigma-70 family RNA polymerase sigma factor [Streptomyces sp. SID8352]
MAVSGCQCGEPEEGHGNGRACGGGRGGRGRPAGVRAGGAVELAGAGAGPGARAGDPGAGGGPRRRRRGHPRRRRRHGDRADGRSRDGVPVTAGPAVRPRDFETFFAASHGGLLARLIMLSGSREDAEDALQESFVEAYRVWERVGGYELPEAWVYRAAVQRLWKTARKRRRGRERLPDLPVPVLAGPEQSAEAREVLRLLAALPPRQRITMVLYCLHGWSQAEIAEALRMTRGGVAANVSKARGTLREALDVTADEAGPGRDAFLGAPEPLAPGRLRPLSGPPDDDPVTAALRGTEDWLRAALLADPERTRRARAALARRLPEGS